MTTADQDSTSSPSPSPSRPRRVVRPPMFQSPSSEPGETLPADSITAADPASAPPSVSELGPELSGPATPHDSAAPPSAPAPSSLVSGTDRKALERAVAAAVSGAGEFANASLTDDEQEAVGLYLVDEDDEARIAKPVASIMARHATPGLLNPDLNDAISAAIAIALYASKQLSRLRELKRAKVRGLLPTDHTPEQEQAA